MESFFCFVSPQGDAAQFETELLSCSVFTHIQTAVAEAGGQTWLADAADAPENGRMTAASFRQMAGNSRVLLVLQPVAALSADTLARLTQQPDCAALMSGKTPLALWGQGDALFALNPAALPESVHTLQANPGEGIAVTDCESAYAAQECIRRRVNLRWMQRGVFLTDPGTTHISPLAKLAAGVTILPGCLIYGATVIQRGAVIGPNALLRDARIGEGVTVNASQVTDSTVGAHTTVGPFAYIRPGCSIGEHVRIGDFVELKNSTIGNGTKVSHLTYIGDSDLGRRINVGCGVVTVNYDGKKKYRTQIEDDSFIGCNVNLISPVRVGQGAYLAAGGTITDDVPEEALVVARARATVKPEWVKRRRESGKL